MSANDVGPVATALKAKIQAVPKVGPVYEHDIYQRDDLRDLIVSTIDSAPVLRAWWITGPRMSAERLTQTSSGYIEREWTWEIHGIDGIPVGDNGSVLVTHRARMLAVTDSIDADIPLGGAVHRSKPCEWRIPPEHRTTWLGIAIAYGVIEKTVITVSTP